jgi:hypothetical protein
MQRETLAFYYRHASEVQQRIVDGPVHEAALNYLNNYVRIIESEFPALHHRFPGCSTSKTGFIGELSFSRGGLRYYGFREIGDNDPRVLFIPADEQREGSRYGNHSNLPYLFGADRLHWVGHVTTGDRTALGPKQAPVDNEIAMLDRATSETRQSSDARGG